MDDIAQGAGISKRTLYEFFKDKETLVIEGIEYNYKRLWSLIEQLEQGPYSILDVILLFYGELMKAPRWYSKKFYDDLRRYPKALNLVDVNKAEFSKKCMQMLSRGVKEGVFQADVNFKILTLLAEQQIKMLKPSDVFSNHSIKEVYNTVLMTFLRGISTEKGRLILDRFAIKQTYNLQ